MKRNSDRIVVMGGSFNPPTLAHYRLMESALDTTGADMGFYVPVSDAYLKRKMRNCHPPVVLSPQLRIKMLETMCCQDSRMQVCDMEIGTIRARTIPTLLALQSEYPDAEIYFVMGADKLELISHFAEKDDFFERFRVVLFSRGNGAIEETLQCHPVLSIYKERIVVASQPEDTEAISSSMIRERMLKGESCQDILMPEVWELFKRLKPKDFPDMICHFKGEYDFLENKYPSCFVWQGIEFNNAEAAFQASKCGDEKERRQYSRMSASKAMAKGQKQVPYLGWESQQLDIMQSILEAKFMQNTVLMQKLMETGNSLIIYGNHKDDTYWGVNLYSWIGENRLGKIIMEIRERRTES